uniref:Uncharacterized protein n=1 Tax=Trichuris muris TaxID=70415 RepID=A0A5S6R1N5_TRIMR
MQMILQLWRNFCLAELCAVRPGGHPNCPRDLAAIVLTCGQRVWCVKYSSQFAVDENEYPAGSSKGGDAELKESLTQLEQLQANPEYPDGEQVLLMRNEIMQLLGCEAGFENGQDSFSCASSSSSELPKDDLSSRDGNLADQLVGHRCLAPYTITRGLDYDNTVVSKLFYVPRSRTVENLELMPRHISLQMNQSASMDWFNRETTVPLLVTSTLRQEPFKPQTRMCADLNGALT